MAAKKPYTDGLAALCLADAAYYTVSRFMGRGRYDTKRFDTPEAAKAEAEGDPRAMIYVVSNKGYTANINGLI